MRVIYNKSLQDYAYEIKREDVRDTVQTIIDFDKESDFETWLIDRYPEGIDDEELYDLFRDDWEWIYDGIGISY